jgi:hypothetical protein
MRRIKIFVTFVLLAMAVMSTAISNRNETRAAEFTCQSGTTCPNPSKCSGDHFTATGCTYTCYKDTGVPGQIVFAGSANCGTTAGGGGGTGGGGGPVGFNNTEGTYCSENWFWDTNCSGPDDPYTPR